jgi:large subunit ribosomal protein L10
MPNAEKTGKVAELKQRIEGSSALLLTDYRGLSVHDATELRRSLADTARFAIVKNTLMQRASADAGIDGSMVALLEGPTAVAFVDGDVVTAAKRVVDAGRRYPALVLKGAFVEGRVLNAAEAAALATLESREVMLSRVAGMLKADLSRAAAVFQAVQARFLRTLDAYKEKVPAGEAETPAADVESGETAAAETESGPTPAAEAEAPEPPAAETQTEAEAADIAESQTETENAQAEEE